MFYVLCTVHCNHHHHHISVMEFGHLLTRSGLMHPEASSMVCHDFFCQLGNSVSLPWVTCACFMFYVSCFMFYVLCTVHCIHHHHISVMEFGHLLTRSGLMYPEASSKVCHDFFCQLGNSVSLPWVTCAFFFPLWRRDPTRVLILEVSRSHTTTHHSR